MAVEYFKKKGKMERKRFLNKEKGYFIWAVGLSIVGCFLLVASLFMEPKGNIHPSVISAAGSVFVFSGSIVGIRGSFDNKLIKFETEMEQRMREERKKEEKTPEKSSTDILIEK